MAIPRSLIAFAVFAIASCLHAEEKPPEHVRVLIEKLDDQDFKARRNAIIKLGRAGPAAKAAIPALQKLLTHKSIGFRIVAACSLRRIDPQTKLALPVIINDLRAGDTTARCLIACDFNGFGAEAVPALLELCDDKDVGIEMWARSCIEKIGKDALPALTQALDSESERVRGAAVHTAQAIREEGP